MKKNMFQPYLRLLYLLVLLALPGCSELNGTKLEPVLGGDVDLVQLGEKVAMTLIRQSRPPLLPYLPDQPVLVTTLVNNDQLEKTSSLGRSLQNDIVAGFVHQGYTVREVKLRRDLLIEAQKGEFMLTRDLREMAGKQHAQAVVVGTYAVTGRVLYLSVRLVAPETQSICAVYEDKIYLDANSQQMLGRRSFNGGVAEEVRPPTPSVLDSILY